MKSNKRIEQEILAKKLNIPYYWKMADKTLASALEKAKKGEKVTENDTVEPISVSTLKCTECGDIQNNPDGTPGEKLVVCSPCQEKSKPKPISEPVLKPMAKATIELKGGFTRQKSIPIEECDKFVENTLDKGLRIVSDGKIRVYSPTQIVKIDITGLPS